MERTTALLITLSLCIAVTSCVNVTTARYSSSVAERSDGQTLKTSDVEVRTYGWNIPVTLLHVMVFPFKAAYHALRLAI